LTLIAATSIYGDLTVSAGYLGVGQYLMGAGELTVTGQFTNSGAVEARALINVYGDYTQTAAGGLTVLVGFPLDPDFGGVAVGGTARLDGALRVFVNYGTTYQVMTFGSRIGDFTSLPSGSYYDANALYVSIDFGGGGLGW